MKLLRLIIQIPEFLVILLIRAYQKLLSPLIGQQCRFCPTCSEYFIQAVHKYGVLRGSCKGILRICRCHPFHRGGYDPP